MMVMIEALRKVIKRMHYPLEVLGHRHIQAMVDVWRREHLGVPLISVQ